VPIAWGPLVLLGLLTIATLAVPLAIFLTLQGGARRAWPPDRPVEWWTFFIGIGGYILLLAACLGIGLVRWRRTVAAAAARAIKNRTAHGPH
jgi:hypothetical protein